jgi:hypothetical protein
VVHLGLLDDYYHYLKEKIRKLFFLIFFATHATLFKLYILEHSKFAYNVCIRESGNSASWAQKEEEGKELTQSCQMEKGTS